MCLCSGARWIDISTSKSEQQIQSPRVNVWCSCHRPPAVFVSRCEPLCHWGAPANRSWVSFRGCAHPVLVARGYWSGHPTGSQPWCSAAISQALGQFSNVRTEKKLQMTSFKCSFVAWFCYDTNVNLEPTPSFSLFDWDLKPLRSKDPEHDVSVTVITHLQLAQWVRSSCFHGDAQNSGFPFLAPWELPPSTGAGVFLSAQVMNPDGVRWRSNRLFLYYCPMEPAHNVRVGECCQRSWQRCVRPRFASIFFFLMSAQGPFTWDYVWLVRSPDLLTPVSPGLQPDYIHT